MEHFIDRSPGVAPNEDLGSTTDDD